MKRVHKIVLNTIAVGAFVSGSMAASAPTRSDHEITPNAQSSQRTEVHKLTRVKRSKPYDVGTASWYGAYFEGRPTASGEPYDMYELTAAHRTLRLGTWVKVTNLRNHRWVLVRINDRGPVPTDRIIDLSYGAARILKMSGRGLAKVRLDIVETPESTSDLAMLSSPR